jgi:diguanylate cyclase (GGDEF)-like protein
MNYAKPNLRSEENTLATMAEVLESLGIAMCLFDEADRTVLWNKTFLDFFPEHAGHVYAGEPYRENLFRFYCHRLTDAERAHIELHIADGIARHQAQARPFTFTHRGRRLRVASLPMPGVGRVRTWVSLSHASRPAVTEGAATDPVLGAQLFENLADGAMALDAAGRIVAVNNEFLALYDVGTAKAVLGLTFPEIVRRAWSSEAGGSAEIDQRIAAFVDNARFAGAAFEVELPGERWRRVIERRMADGTAYLSHADISVLKQQQRALQEAYRRLQTLAVTDPLTGLGNRRGFEEGMLRHGSEHASQLALLLIDIDRFKQVNDLFGHQSGDLCLQMIAGIIQGLTRRDRDLVARFGGEEFAVVLPGADVTAAMRTAERIRKAIEADRSQEFNHDVAITVSVGVAVAAEGQFAGMNLLIHLADQALYRAKREGRNRTVLG